MKDEIKKRLEIASKSLTLDEGVMFDMGCGNNKYEGSLGIDTQQLPMVDIIQDLEVTPYKNIPSDCAKLIVASHIIEHLKPWLFVPVMNEWWRILKVGGILGIATPYAGSSMYWRDPTHINGCNEQTFFYFDPLSPNCGDVLYKVYHPKPWKVDQRFWNSDGNMEVKMFKRADDPSYYTYEKDAKTYK